MRRRLNLITRKRRNTCNVHKCFDAMNRSRANCLFSICCCCLFGWKIETNALIRLIHWLIYLKKSRLPQSHVFVSRRSTHNRIDCFIQDSLDTLFKRNAEKLQMNRVSQSVSQSVIDMLKMFEKQKQNERR